MITEELAPLLERLARIDAALEVLVKQRPVHDYYTTAQAVELLEMAEFTVREWYRRGRIQAEKRKSGCGAHYQWVISRAELQRYEREGLLRSR